MKPAASHSRWYTRGILGLLFAATLFAYWPATRCGFAYDDITVLVNNPHLNKGFTVEGLNYALTTRELGYPMPVTLLSLLADGTVYHMRAWGFHATNIALHVANAMLLFVLLRQMTGDLWRSGVVALLFSVHPLRVESVAWITERKDVLATFIGLLALLAYVRYARQPSMWQLAVVYGLTLISLLAKPMFLPMPVLLLLLDYWPLRRVKLVWKGKPIAARSPDLAEGTAGDAAGDAMPPSDPAFPQVTLARAVVTKIPLVVLVILMSVYDYLFELQTAAMGNSVGEYGIFDRIAGAVMAMTMYLWKTVRIDQLGCYYPRPTSWSSAEVSAAGIMLLAITALALWQARRSAWLLVGWLWYLAVLVPSSGLVTLGDFYFADRYSYMSSVGLLMMIVWSISDRAARPTAMRVAWAVVITSLVVVLCLAARSQCGVWKDNLTLFENAARVAPDNWMAEWQLLIGYTNAGDYDRALTHASAAIRLAPADEMVHQSVAILLEKRGDLTGAAEEFRRCLDLNPHMSTARAHFAAINASRRITGGVDVLNARIAANPRDAIAQHQLGVLLSETADAPAAISHLRTSLELDPTILETYLDLGVKLQETGKLNAAVAVFDHALKRWPDDPDVHLCMAAAMSQSGRYAKAADHCRRVLAKRPGSVAALSLLGTSELALLHPQPATAALELAIALNPNDAHLREKFALARSLREQDAASVR